jgi:hypothetical protein
MDADGMDMDGMGIDPCSIIWAARERPELQASPKAEACWRKLRREGDKRSGLRGVDHEANKKARTQVWVRAFKDKAGL